MKLDLELLQVVEAERRADYREKRKKGLDLTDVTNAKPPGMPKEKCRICGVNPILARNKRGICVDCRSRTSDQTKAKKLGKEKNWVVFTRGEMKRIGQYPSKCLCDECVRLDESRKRFISQGMRSDATAGRIRWKRHTLFAGSK